MALLKLPKKISLPTPKSIGISVPSVKSVVPTSVPSLTSVLKGGAPSSSASSISSPSAASLPSLPDMGSLGGKSDLGGILGGIGGLASGGVLGGVMGEALGKGAQGGSYNSGNLFESLMSGKLPSKVKQIEEAKQTIKGLDERTNDLMEKGSGWESMLKGDKTLRDDLLYKAQTIDPNSIDKAGISSILKDAEGRFGNVKLDDRGLNAIRDRALGTGPSAWATLQKQKQGMEEQDALDTAAKQSQGAAANAWSQMAMRGGVGGGGGARLARQAMNDQMLASQGVRRQGMSDRLGIDIADDAQKTDLLKNLPAMELARIQPEMDKAKILTGVQSDEQSRTLDADKFNIGNTLATKEFNANALNNQSQYNIGNTMKETDAKRQQDLEMWKKKMEVLSADKVATTQSMAGKK